ncbi:MAG: RsmD family RNA methyltransferase [Polyangiaceae bacterium]|nr:RsmD family RNA methyltransferase [Polyangiaceae bacterium]
MDAHGVGLYEAGTHHVVDTPGCPVLSPAVERAVAALRVAGVHRAAVSSVDVREVDRGVMVTVATAEPDHEALGPLLAEVSAGVPNLVSLARSRRAPDAVQVLGRSPAVVVGTVAERHTPDPEAPYHYAAPGAFTQAHPGQLVALHRDVVAALSERLGALAGRSVLEVYAGTGALGLRLARAGARVTLVEAFPPAMELAARSAREQGLDLCTLGADAGVAVSELAARGEGFDAVIVNPPRRGATPDVRRALGRLSPRVVVYVSCAPQTLARDAAHLTLLGLAPVEVVPYDMIPLSAAVEVLAVFGPAPPREPRVIHMDDALIAVDKPPHEPVTPQGEHANSLLERVRRRLGAPEAVPVHRLDLGTSGVCLFARRPAAVADLARALREGQKSYVALARGVTHQKGHLRRPLREGARELVASTRYVRQRVVGGHSLLLVCPEQGRTHQIRRHLAGVGRPLVGDSRYGDLATNRHFEHRHGLDRTFLHLLSICLRISNRSRTLRAELAADLAAVLASLERG